MPAPKNAHPKPAPPELTILRMKNIVLTEERYAIRGMLSVDIVQPHCAVALFALTRGAVTVWINGEHSGRKYAHTQAEGHDDFAIQRARLRRSGPAKLRHIER